MDPSSRRKVITAMGNGTDAMQEELTDYLKQLAAKVTVSRLENKQMMVLIEVNRNPFFGYPMIAIIRVFMRIGEVFEFTYGTNPVKTENSVILTIILDKPKR